MDNISAANDDVLRLPTRFAAGAGYYRMMARHDGPVIVCGGERFDKRCKSAHRTALADTRGRLELTVPVEKPYGRTWADTRVSLHGHWWETARTALESAYGRTPFFEFYADDFMPLLDPARFSTVAALNADFDRAIRKALGITASVVYSDDPAVRPQRVEPFEPEPYWQVRDQSLGFIPSLSILDMIFNLGPEALLELWR